MSPHSPDEETVSMTRIVRRTGNSGTSIGAILTAFALVCVLGGATAVAQDRGEDRGNRGENRGRGHDDRGRYVRAPERHHARVHEGRDVRYGYGYDQPTYGYSPPPIVYAPPRPSAGINLIIPLHFR
jgi:hypothetical protein